jgi:CheY-like chemotaxis protein
MHGKRVLIVDDDICVIRVLPRVFERAGCQVATAGNGEKALALLTAQHFDVMISDIQMPKMTGEQLCIHLWTAGPYLPKCTIVVTSRSDERERAWATQIPGIRLVEKPVGPKQLLRLVKDHFAAEGAAEPRWTEEKAA